LEEISRALAEAVKNISTVTERFDMAIGIRITGDDNSLDDSKIVSDGVGVDVIGHRNVLSKLDVYVSDDDVRAIIETLSLPKETPPELLRSAIDLVRASNKLDSLDNCGLKNWLIANGFNLAFWAQTAVGLFSLCFPSG
jgi:hypothetical protein